MPNTLILIFKTVFDLLLPALAGGYTVFTKISSCDTCLLFSKAILGLFLPGYIWSYVFLPKEKLLTIERLILSVTLSITINLLGIYYVIHFSSVEPNLLSFSLISLSLCVMGGVIAFVLSKIEFKKYRPMFSKTQEQKDTPKVLFLTRAYPPVIGGMENLSYNLTTKIKCEKKIIALKKWDRKHIIWFIPYTILYTLLNGWKYNIIHLGDAVMGISCLLLRPIYLKKKFVMNAHGLDITYKDKPTILGKIYGIYLSLLIKLGQPDLVIGCSSFTAKLANEVGFKTTTFIPPGVETEVFSRTSGKDKLYKLLKERFNKSFNDSHCFILTLGRLTKRKGVGWFIENVLPHLPTNTVYLVAGKVYFSEREDERVLKLADEKGLADRVLYLGGVSEEVKLLLYTTADLFVMSNIQVKGDMEGFGMVGIEAAAAGLPVVASRLEGIPDAIIDEQNGLLVSPEDGDGFINKISALLTNDQYRETFGEKAKAYVHKHYSWENIVNKHLNAFKTLLNE